MKKIHLIISLILCLAIALSLVAVVISANAGGDQPETASPTELINAMEAAYNSGYYKRSNEIFLKECDEVGSMFVGSIVLNKDTYFHSTWLWMDTNSGYAGAEVGIETPTSHFKYVGGEQKTDYTISAAQNVSFYTLKSFIDGFNAEDWTKEGGAWVSKTEANKEMALGFIASCFKNDGEDAIELDRVAVTIEGESLIFTLYAKAESDLLTNGFLPLAIAKATVTPMNSTDIDAAIAAELAD